MKRSREPVRNLCWSIMEEFRLHYGLMVSEFEWTFQRQSGTGQLIVGWPVHGGISEPRQAALVANELLYFRPFVNRRIFAHEDHRTVIHVICGRTVSCL